MATKKQLRREINDCESQLATLSQGNNARNTGKYKNPSPKAPHNILEATLRKKLEKLKKQLDSME